MSQMSRATRVVASVLAPIAQSGRIRNVLRSGRRTMSDSSMRTNPSIDEPSKAISPSRAFSLPIGHFHVLVDAENVGELQPHETNTQPPTGLQNVLSGPTRPRFVVNGFLRGGSRHGAPPFSASGPALSLVPPVLLGRLPLASSDVNDSVQRWHSARLFL